MNRCTLKQGVAVAAVALAGAASGQGSMPVNPAASMLPAAYGAPLPLASAKRMAAAAIAEAVRINVPMVIAITDPQGSVIYLEKMDLAISGGVNVAPAKARSAALYKRPTKVFEEAIAGGGAGLRFLRLPDAIPIEGGLPIVVGGQIVGAIGVSGGTGVQDGAVGKAALDALN